MSIVGSRVTPVAAGDTLADLRAAIRLQLVDATTWPDATLDSYIGDAIRFYSGEFPRRWRHTLSLATGTQVYDLPGNHGVVAVLRVEYPAGETPESYLVQAQENSAEFQAGYGCYALRGISTATDMVTDTAAAQIRFAETVSTGETAVIEFLGAHPIPEEDEDQVTVPPSHWEALVAFVDFRAHWQLEAGEAVTMETNSIALSQLGQEARMAWNRFKEVVDRLTWRSGGQSAVVSWGDARIY